MTFHTRIAVAGLCLALALPVAGAHAKAPPAGKYECTISGMLFGKVTIKKRSSYTRNGKRGKFGAPGGIRTFPDGVRGYKISFKTGSFKGFKGRWYKAKDGTPQGTYEIALENPLNDFESIYCVRRK